MTEERNRSRVEIRHLLWPGFVALEGEVDGDSGTESGWDYELGGLVGAAVHALTAQDDFDTYNFLLAVMMRLSDWDFGRMYRLVRAATDIYIDAEDVKQATTLLKELADKRRAAAGKQE